MIAFCNYQEICAHTFLEQNDLLKTMIEILSSVIHTLNYTGVYNKKNKQHFASKVNASVTENYLTGCPGMMGFLNSGLENLM